MNDEFGLKMYNGNDILSTNDLYNKKYIIYSSGWQLDSSISSTDSFTINNSYDTVKEGVLYYRLLSSAKNVIIVKQSKMKQLGN